jgi:hypothetical protein
MIGMVDLNLVMMCDPDNTDKAEMIAEYLAAVILAQSPYGISGAQSWIEDLLD